MKLMSYYDLYDQTNVNFVPNLIQIGVDNTHLSHQGKQFFILAAMIIARHCKDLVDLVQFWYTIFHFYTNLNIISNLLN